DDICKPEDAGTLAHAMALAHVRGIDWQPEVPIDPVLLDKARSGFAAYLAWERMHKPRIRRTDIVLASDRYSFGGSIDAVAVVDGKLALMDWRTSNAVYQDHLIALAACKALWEENEPAHPLKGGFHLFRFAREDADFTHHFYAKLREGWQQF